MSFISTYNLETDVLKLVDSDFVKSDRWEYLIFENDGNLNREGEFMAFDMNGLELVIFYDLNISGKIYHDSGDYYNPSYTDVEITCEDINITEVTLDGYDIELTKDLNCLFLETVKVNL